ncbi:MAG: hypothetical protein GY757_51975, partial [bacterium]|nr:hypothetical protein [bacterium]
VRAGISQKEELAERFTFDERQADYYFNAARYLNLVDRTKNGSLLTGFGHQVVEASRNNRHSLLIEAILSRKVFYDTYLEYRNSDLGLEKEQVTELMGRNGVLADSTDNMRRRRAGTILSWCKWISGIAENPYKGSLFARD